MHERATRRVTYGNAPLAEWPQPKEPAKTKQYALEVATDRQMQMHSKRIADEQDAQRKWYRR